MQVEQTVQRRGMAQMTTAMAISGTIGWFVVKSGRAVEEVVFWRCLFGLVTLSVICAAKGLLRRDAISRSQVLMAVLGGVAVVLNWLLLFAAFPRASIAIATTVYNTQPFMLVALGALLFGERLTALNFWWLLVAFAGVLLLAEIDPAKWRSDTNYLFGIAMALGAAFFYAVAAIVAKRLTGVPPILVVLIQVTVGVILLGPLIDLHHSPEGALAWSSLATLGVVHTGLAFALMYGAIQKLPTHVVGALSFTYPLVAIAVDVIAFHHRLHTVQIAGGAAILLSAAGNTLGWSPVSWLGSTQRSSNVRSRNTPMKKQG